MRMHTVGLVLAGGIALVSVGALVQLWWAWLDIPELADVAMRVNGTSPRVSIVIAARDEERHIESALTALLAQTYPDFELVVVDDRSSDGTPEVLDRFARDHAHVTVVRVDTLPDGWLGKNHALHVGAARATGELLLFADADVILRPDALARAVRLIEIEHGDHLAVAPDLVLPSIPLALVVNYFMMWFLLWLRPWKARDSRSRAFIGIGAFNLVRASVYHALGGHTRIAMRPDDDLMLGKILKHAGRRQLFAAGGREITVEWYRTLGELARGFRKNAYAGMKYSAAFTAYTIAGNLVLAVLPFVAVWISVGAIQMLFAIAAVAQMAAYAGAAYAQRTRPWLALFYPFAALIFVAILIAAVARTLRQRGIEWRDTRYSLDQLRSNRV